MPAQSYAEIVVVSSGRSLFYGRFPYPVRGIHECGTVVAVDVTGLPGTVVVGPESGGDPVTG